MKEPADQLVGALRRELVAHHTEFFIRKAIGWALRSYASIELDAVKTFVTTHDSRLSGLSKREALKRRQ